MLKRTGLAILGAAAMSLVASHALAQFSPITDPSKDEAKCQASTGKALTGEVGGINKCTGKCFKDARKLSGPYTDCFFPYAGSTGTCVNDGIKGPVAKAGASIAKACTDAPGKDRCPECYTAQGANLCTTGVPFINTINVLTGATADNVYCTEKGGGTPTAAVAKCEDGNSKTLVKYVGAIQKCYDKCYKNELGGKVAPGVCIPPGTTDPATIDCLNKATAKTISGIDKACFIAPAVAPSCYDGGGLRPNTATGWASLVKTIVDSQVDNIICGSPSGAFLQ